MPCSNPAATTTANSSSHASGTKPSTEIAVAGLVDPGQSLEHRSQAGAADHEGRDADQERRPAMRADDEQAQRAGGEAGRDDRRVDAHDAAAPRRRRQRDHPDFAEHIERVGGDADQEAQRKPGIDVLGPADQREQQGRQRGAAQRRAAGAEPPRQRRDERRGHDEADRRHRRRQPDHARRHALPLQDEAEQRIAEALRDREHRNGGDHAGNGGPGRPVGGIERHIFGGHGITASRAAIRRQSKRRAGPREIAALSRCGPHSNYRANAGEPPSAH